MPSLPALFGTLLMPVSSLASWFLLFALGQTQAKPGRGGMRHPYSYLLPVAGFYWLWACKVRPRLYPDSPLSPFVLLVLLYTIVRPPDTPRLPSPIRSLGVPPLRAVVHCVVAARRNLIPIGPRLPDITAVGLHTGTAATQE